MQMVLAVRRLSVSWTFIRYAIAIAALTGCILTPTVSSAQAPGDTDNSCNTSGADCSCGSGDCCSGSCNADGTCDLSQNGGQCSTDGDCSGGLVCLPGGTCGCSSVCDDPSCGSGYNDYDTCGCSNSCNDPSCPGYDLGACADCSNYCNSTSCPGYDACVCEGPCSSSSCSSFDYCTCYPYAPSCNNSGGGTPPDPDNGGDCQPLYSGWNCYWTC